MTVNLVSFERLSIRLRTGLCHDLGHGPLSHLFEHSFVHVLDPESKWRHERASIMMFDHLLLSNDLLPIFAENGLNDLDRIFIKEMIYGELPIDDPTVRSSSGKKLMLREGGKWRILHYRKHRDWGDIEIIQIMRIFQKGPMYQISSPTSI